MVEEDEHTQLTGRLGNLVRRMRIDDRGVNCSLWTDREGAVDRCRNLFRGKYCPSGGVVRSRVGHLPHHLR